MDQEEKESTQDQRPASAETGAGSTGHDATPAAAASTGAADGDTDEIMTEARGSRNEDVLRRLNLHRFPSRDPSGAPGTAAAAAASPAGDGALEELASPQAAAARDNVTAMVESAMESVAPSRPDEGAFVEGGGAGGAAGAAAPAGVVPPAGSAGGTAMTVEDTASGQSEAGRERGREGR